MLKIFKKKKKIIIIRKTVWKIKLADQTDGHIDVGPTLDNYIGIRWD